MLHLSFVKNDDQDFNPRKYEVINAKTIIIIIPESAELVEVLKKEKNGMALLKEAFAICVFRSVFLCFKEIKQGNWLGFLVSLGTKNYRMINRISQVLIVFASMYTSSIDGEKYA